MNTLPDPKEPIHVIGAAIVDVLARPVSLDVFSRGSAPVEDTRILFGGDALNEACVLSNLGKMVHLISTVGEDEAGSMVLSYLKKNGVDVKDVKFVPGLSTGVNIVLVDEKGERCFLTNPRSSLRSLSYSDLAGSVSDLKGIVSFASLFVSKALPVPELSKLFCLIKQNGNVILCADMTRPKNGEKLQDLAEFLPYIDFLFPNETEIADLTGDSDPSENASLLVNAGVSCAVIKTGRRGCLVRTKNTEFCSPAYDGAHCLDTTGAGDTFVAGFLYGLSEGLSLEECARFANAAASCAVEVPGAGNTIRSKGQVLERFYGMA